MNLFIYHLFIYVFFIKMRKFLVDAVILIEIRHLFSKLSMFIL